MLTLLCHRTAPDARDVRTHFYRVEISYNLFGEYTVIREWGRVGTRGHHVSVWFANLREAVLVADRSARRAGTRGYDLIEKQFATAA
ncbi:WGR domain-containing protein [Roseinatronobacter alkalisoli]|uniref:WGR domain-containing protein n=1 Tax=Roseinatronobacter alkalisoli TaxID=3028235 RepID=A0ABT5TIV4_9RHOB|nr:WGR domain-containing protein [Roseinatronobacter sp. HJB301]MDD7973878.1 WGR domain-containing protein [Roseinatronobacter sp. HJB301]